MIGKNSPSHLLTYTYYSCYGNSTSSSVIVLQVQKKMKDRNITIVQFEAWVQVKMFKKYKSLDQLFISFFLSCPFIGSLISSTTNQRAAQTNYYTEMDFGVPGSDWPNVRFGRTVWPNFYCAVRPKWQNFFLQNTELFFVLHSIQDLKIPKEHFEINWPLVFSSFKLFHAATIQAIGPIFVGSPDNYTIQVI